MFKSAASRTILSLALSIALAPALVAQSVNIDFSMNPTDVPAPTFGAAGKPGVWNGVKPIAGGPAIALVDRLGACTNVTISTPPFTIGMGTDSNAFLPADVNALFMDGFFAQDLGDRINIGGLLPGQYNVLLYGLNPNHPSYETLFTGGFSQQIVGGAWTGSFIAGVTHASATVTVGPTGKLQFFWALGFQSSPSGWFSGMQIDPITPALDGTPSQLSLASGGQHTLTLNAGVARASNFYLMLGSVTGVAPGLQFGRVCLPLNIDPYFNLTLKQPKLSPFQGYIGMLDANGSASASFNIPPGSDPSLAGVTFYHSYIAAEVLGTIDFASNAVAVTLVP